MASPLATRRVGRRINLSINAVGLFTFGPFLPGEGVADIVIAVQSGSAVSVGAGSEAHIAVGVSPAPSLTTADFLASQRLLTDGVPAQSGSTAPGLPLGGLNAPTVTYAATDTLSEVIATTDSNAVTVAGTVTGTVAEAGAFTGLSWLLQAGPFVLPINWRALPEERYLTVFLVAPLVLVGSLWIRTCGSPDPSPLIPPPPGDVGDCDGGE